MGEKASAWKRFRGGEWDNIPGWQFNVLVPLLSVGFAIREFFRDRAMILASSLAYTTAISLVPLLSVVTSALAIFGAFDESNQSLVFYLEPVFPSAASQAAEHLSLFAQTSAASVGGISALIFLVIAIFLFMDIERAFNAIWHARNDRPILRKILTFYFVVTFGPVLASTSVGLTARTQLVVDRFGLETGFLVSIVPFFIAFLLFTLMNQLLPNTKVHWSAAIAGGLFTALAFEAVKFGFNVYVSQVILESYNKIYGALGLIPLCLIWIYICWILVLLGAELAYTIQNLRTIVEVDAAKERTPLKQKRNIYNPLVGLEILAPVARHFKGGHGALKEADLIRQTGYDENFLREVVAELESLGAVKAVEVENDERAVMPAKMLDDVSLVPIAEHFFDFTEPNSVPMQKLQGDIRRVTLEQLGGKTALALVPHNDHFLRSWTPPEYPEELVSGAHARQAYLDPDADASQSAEIPKSTKASPLSGHSSTEGRVISRGEDTSASIEVSDELVVEAIEAPSPAPSSSTALRQETARLQTQESSTDTQDSLKARLKRSLKSPRQEPEEIDIDLGDDWAEIGLDEISDIDAQLRETAELSVDNSGESA